MATPPIVHPTLHESGFGNQFGMLLQHVAIAQLSSRPLALPPFHVPREHRAGGTGGAVASSLLAADAALNLS